MVLVVFHLSLVEHLVPVGVVIVRLVASCVELWNVLFHVLSPCQCVYGFFSI